MDTSFADLDLSNWNTYSSMVFCFPIYTDETFGIFHFFDFSQYLQFIFVTDKNFTNSMKTSLSFSKKLVIF